jgi:phthiocerol/phenolphthiocerol synthesis type-I polyketide synthase E
VFLFPGQGAQYPGMAEGLYRNEVVVRRAIDQCARILEPEIGADLRKVLFPPVRQRGRMAEELRDTKWAQPALFTVGYALAALWRSWGVEPTAMIGHSVGEFVAATLAGVMPLEDALRLIARRGRLISLLPRGSMLAVMAPHQELTRFLTEDISVAAVNAPGFTVLSGPDAAIDRVADALAAESLPARRLHTSHAFHSAMMEPILAEFEELVAAVQLSPPSSPFAATLTGQWADGSVTRPEYWSAQIRSTVRFADAVRTVLAGPPGGALFVEVGPGNTLATFVGECARADGGPTPCLTSLPGPHDHRADMEVVLGSLGELWAHGGAVDWNAFHRDEPRRRVPLPTYPFERRSYWIGSRQGQAPERRKTEERDTSGWFHRPVWRRIDPAAPGASFAGQRILVFDEGGGLGAAVVDQVRAAGGDAVAARLGAGFERLDEYHYTLNPAETDGYARLAAAVCADEPKLAAVIDCWAAGPPGTTDLDAAATVTLLGPMRLVHALGSQATIRPLPLMLVARGAARVHDADVMDPPRALGAGMAKVLPQEHPGIRAVHVDVDDDPAVPKLLLDELAAGAAEPNVALRGGARFAETYEPVVLHATDTPRGLPEQPVVMVTGGLGHMGLNLSEGLFRHMDARLVLVGRTALPDPEDWAAESEGASTTQETRQLLRRLADMRAERDEVLVLKADMNDARAVQAAVDVGIARFGRIDLLVHGAARIDAAAFGSVAETGPEVVDAQFSPKLRGLFHLIDAFRGREPSRWVLHSSISTVLGGLGLAAYSAANAVLDAIAIAGGERWLSIDWDLWDNAAEAQMAGMPDAIQPPEGLDAFLRLLCADVGQRVLVVVEDLAGRLKAWVRHADAAAPKGGLERHPRPNLSTAFVEPRSATERDLAEIWGTQLGIERIGIHDRFFDLGGHSLLAVQVSSEIRDKFQVEMPVLKLFQAPTVGELAVLIDQARAGAADTEPARLFAPTPAPLPEAPPIEGEAPEAAAKRSYREFYDDVTRRLEQSGVAEASFFLNYGYRSLGTRDDARSQVPEGVFNANSVRLALELIGPTDLRRKRVLDVGCGRGGTAGLMAEQFEAEVTGVDLSSAAIGFCRRTHRNPRVTFEVGDAEHLPCDDASFDAVTNVESSHTYPNLRAFYAEVARVLVPGGVFLYTDLLPVARWLEVRALLGPLGLKIKDDREITPNVLASCDEVAATRAHAFGGSNAAIDNFLAVPGSMVYEQMRSGAWEYRIVRAVRT